MGATNFVETVLAKTAREGFESLSENARYEYGNDGYNGTISTCSMANRPFYIFKDSYKKSNDEKAMEMIENDDYGEKWLAKHIDLGVVEYKIIKPKKINTEKEKPKYTLAYTVKPIDYLCNQGRGYYNIPSFKTKTEAVNKAMELASKDNAEYFVSKEYVLNEGNSEVARIELEEKSYKTKPKNIPKGCRLIEIHKYMFFGWASC